MERRTYLATGGSAVAALLTGCLGSTDDGGAAGEGSTATERPTATESTTTEDPGYDAALSPVGTVEFDAVPEDAFTVFPWYADMAAAVGHGDSVNSLWWADGFDAILQYFLSDLDGVDVSWSGLPGEYGASKERLYELDSDVHLADPAWVSALDDWDDGDVEAVADNVAPWFGNHYSNRHGSPPEPWADGYEYYSLWDLFERVAAVYRERERYEALRAVHDDLLATIEAGLPPEEERPTVAYLQFATDLEAVYAFRLNAPGFYNAHTRPLGAVDAFADVEFAGEFAAIDFETLLETDPDVLLTLWGMTERVDFERLRANLRDHSVGSELAAVENDRVYTQGTRFQGPLQNLYQLEMTAKQLYPEQFGAWPGYADGESYPDFPADERLFDRERVAAAVAGDR